MEVVDSMSKVDEMVQLYDSEKVLNLTVLKHKAEWPIGLNRDDGEATNLVDVPVVLSDNKSGINFMAEQAEEVYPVAIDYSDVLYLGTQQSSNINMNKGKGKEVVESDEDEEDLEDGYDSEKEVDDNEHTKVTIDWLAKQSEQAVRIDPNTTVDTLIDNANQKWGVPIPKSKAYRARKIAFSVVMGDQKAQYIRLRDYLQAVIDTNPGSRCIVTTKHVVEHPSTNPRHTEDGNTSASASTAPAPPLAPARAAPAPATAPQAPAPPAPAPARAPLAPARGRAAPAPAPAAKAAPAAPRASAPARAPAVPRASAAARFSAPRTTTASDPGTTGRRVSGRKRLLTGRMKGYLTAGKFTYRQDPPAPAPDA
ncbi:hypothetical protein ACQ4PT_008886 [Festuca glaucescens]